MSEATHVGDGEHHAQEDHQADLKEEYFTQNQAFQAQSQAFQAQSQAFQAKKNLL